MSGVSPVGFGISAELAHHPKPIVACMRMNVYYFPQVYKAVFLCPTVGGLVGNIIGFTIIYFLD